MKKYLLIAAGCTSLGAGIVGIFLPVLPTTPFLLLAGACFVRSSDRLYRWLTNHPVFGPYISNYLRFKAVTLRSKIASISLMWVVLGSTIVFATESLHLRLFLAAIGIGVTVHLVTMKTLTRKMLAESAET